MGGGGGGIIVRNVAQSTLTEPTVHGQLPATMTGALDAVLWSDSPTNTVLSDPSSWGSQDCEIVGRAFHWALTNLS
jgi:hypothetical protein